MAYQTFYRKYRPKSFELVYGQDTIVKTLKNIIKNNKLSHAYLFTGPRGTGKTSCAKLFAKAINCSNNSSGDACNECENCISYNENKNPDIIEIDAASNNGVDEIREIKSKVNLVPSISKYKVYIIDEVHMLSIGAFNALLKTLEEPPEYVIFILATTEPQKLPATIISRCQRFDFKNISIEKIKECLKNIIQKENITITDDALNSIAINSKGGMRDAIGMLDQANVFSSGNIKLEDIDELSGNVSDAEMKVLFDAIINQDYESINNIVNDFSFKGKDFSLILMKMIAIIRNIILSRKINNYDKTSKEQLEQFEKIKTSQLYDLLESLSEKLSKMQYVFQKDVAFEIEMIQLMDNLNEKESLVSANEKNNIKNVNILKDNVSRETYNEIKEVNHNSEISKEQMKMIDQLKDIRINNILKESSKNEITFIIDMWKNINDYLINDEFKISAGILISGKPVAASKKGIIITLPTDSVVKRVEKRYEESKNLLQKIFNQNYKLVYISESKWKEIRPSYVLKVKNNQLERIDESELIKKLKEIKIENSVDEFYDLIEMEE